MFRSIPFAVIALLLGISGVYSQAASMTDLEFSKMLSAANKIARSTPYRDKMMLELAVSVDGPWERYSYQETERIGPERSRHVQFTGNRFETIVIGDLVYQRKADGPWIRSRRSKPQSTQTVWTINEATAEYTRNTASAESLPIVVERTLTGGSARTKDGTVFDRSGTSRIWFDAQGRIVKEEHITFNHERQRFSRTTRDIEYDPTIRIESPID